VEGREVDNPLVALKDFNDSIEVGGLDRRRSTACPSALGSCAFSEEKHVVEAVLKR
jgi:hypothetical protein